MYIYAICAIKNRYVTMQLTFEVPKYCLWEEPAPRLIRAEVFYDSQTLSDIEQ